MDVRNYVVLITFWTLTNVLFLVSGEMAEDCIKEKDFAVDLVFVLDDSGSIRDKNPSNGSYDNWQLQLDFVSDVIDHLDVSSTSCQIGLVVFSSGVYSRFFLNTFSDKADVIRSIQRTSYSGGNTNTQHALKLMHEEQFSRVHGDRPDVPNVAIVITDGGSNVNEERTIPEAEAAHEKGIHLLAVGITSTINEMELMRISSPPHQQGITYWIAPDFHSLKQFITGINDAMCIDEGDEAPWLVGVITLVVLLVIAIIIVMLIIGVRRWKSRKLQKAMTPSDLDGCYSNPGASLDADQASPQTVFNPDYGYSSANDDAIYDVIYDNVHPTSPLKY